MTNNEAENDHEATGDECIGLVVEHLKKMTALRVAEEMRSSALLGYGWWIRVVRTADAVRTLRRSGFGHEAGSLVRTALHHAAALCWLLNAPDEALKAVRYEDERRKHTLAKGARDRGWNIGEDDFPKPENKPAGTAYLSDFEKLCGDLELRNLYIPYRVESGYLHPSALSADVYLEIVDDAISLRTEARTAGVDLRATAISVGLATSAFSKLIGDDGLTRVVDELARRLNIDLAVPILRV